ncbi:MAG: 3-methyl-2-oxobutanoate dehydrogenase subunit VorB [Firmicutes bacterium]|nr:3-methyl-2-oxobutanoate dehydrogenase subunit VorB [Bacillota bacterium]
MAEKILMKGNEALAEAALAAGCRYFFGYPITPQNEVPEYMSRRLPQLDGVFVQAESEVAAINMVYGAASTGVRCMTSSSSPGISLKQEGISYLVGSQLPCVVVNMMRGGPGLGTIQPSQSDYFQSTKGGGHGDYKMLVLAPSTVQEMVDLTMDAFDLAEKYRNPVIVLGDGMLGQMMEPVAIEPREPQEADISWATTGTLGERKPNVINSLFIKAEECEEHNEVLQAKFAKMLEEVRYEILHEDAEFFLVGYGTTARIMRSVVEMAREEGISVGLIRPITLYPFPDEAFDKVQKTAKGFLTVEMSAGQMVEDVRLAVNGRQPVRFHGRTGGMAPEPLHILAELKKLIDEVK